MPPRRGAGSIGLSASLTVLNSNHAWVLVPGTDFFSGTLYRTSDGGISWSSNTVPFGGGLHAISGWQPRARPGRTRSRAGSEAVELFQTSDGGASWSSVFHNDPGLPGSSDSLPLAGIKNGMTFSDGQNRLGDGFHPGGWRGLSLYHPRRRRFLVTTEPAAARPATRQYQYLAQAPVFFGKDGFLPLTIYRPGRPI